jgi:type VI secretion system VasD/TssJ family lipoprotein
MLTKPGIFAVFIGAVVGAGACGHTPLPPPAPCTAPEPIVLAIHASAGVNPDDKGQPLATTVRVYQLKETARLADASLEQILDSDRTVLADDLLSVNELTLYPGESSQPALVRKDGAAYVALVAFFRDSVGSNWRALSKLEAPNPQHCGADGKGAPGSALRRLTVELNENRIEVR